MGYLHVEVATHQSAKRPGSPCGDVVATDRSAVATTVVCADGLGSGVRANIFARMAVARLLALVQGGTSLRNAFAAIARTMNQARGHDLPFAAFGVARILPDGTATVLTYEAPPPILLSGRQASVLAQRTVTLDGALVGESHCVLTGGEGLMLVSDGVTQAGLGNGLVEGLTAEGAGRFLTGCLARGTAMASLPERLHNEARKLWGETAGDDCTAVLATCRPGTAVNILTGPPSHPSLDARTVERFLRAQGYKVVCGASTAKLVARQMGTPLEVEQTSRSAIAPPAYRIAGVDLVTEGAITLNQVYNILDADPSVIDDDSGVTELWQLLQVADRVNVTAGLAVNPANESGSFRQRGLLSRRQILPLLANKLRQAGKLVVVESV